MRKEEIVENWKGCNKIALEILKNIPDIAYNKKPFEGRFKTFAWEFACLLTTRGMYIQGYKEGKINEKTKAASDKDAEMVNKIEMRKRLIKTNKEIIRILEEKKGRTISFFGEKRTKEGVFIWLLQHEQVHFGKLMLYCAQAKVQQSNELKQTWGEHTFQ